MARPKPLAMSCPSGTHGSRSGGSLCGRAGGRSSATARGSPDLRAWLTSAAVPADLPSPFGKCGRWRASVVMAASMIRRSASRSSSALRVSSPGSVTPRSSKLVSTGPGYAWGISPRRASVGLGLSGRTKTHLMPYAGCVDDPVPEAHVSRVRQQNERHLQQRRVWCAMSHPITDSLLRY